jgi:hypothetical protein
MKDNVVAARYLAHGAILPLVLQYKDGRLPRRFGLLKSATRILTASHLHSLLQFATTLFSSYGISHSLSGSLSHINAFFSHLPKSTSVLTYKPKSTSKCTPQTFSPFSPSRPPPLQLPIAAMVDTGTSSTRQLSTPHMKPSLPASPHLHPPQLLSLQLRLLSQLPRLLLCQSSLLSL